MSDTKTYISPTGIKITVPVSHIKFDDLKDNVEYIDEVGIRYRLVGHTLWWLTEVVKYWTVFIVNINIMSQTHKDLLDDTQFYPVEDNG